MKKVLSLVLVAVLALGMGMSAFAAVEITGFEDGYGLINGVPGYENDTYNYSSRNTGRTVDKGDILVQDEESLIANLRVKMFNWADSGTTPTSTGDLYYALDTRAFANAFKHKDLGWTASGPTRWEQVGPWANQALQAELDSFVEWANTFTEAGNNPNSYSLKYVSKNVWNAVFPTTADLIQFYNPDSTSNPSHGVFCVIDAAGAACTNPGKFAAGAATHAVDTATSVASFSADAEYDWSTYSNIGLVKSIKKNERNTLYFLNSANELLVSTEKSKDVERNLTAAEIRDNKITLGTVVRGDSNGIKDIELRRDKGDVRIRFATELISVDDIDTEAVVYLKFDGKSAREDRELVVIANIANRVEEVYKNYDYVDIEDGTVAEAMDFIENMEVYVGNGATVHTKFFKGKKYYCITKRDKDQADDIVFKQYKDVDNVLSFYNVGLNNSGDYVTLSTDYADYWVYDVDMNYIGRGTEKLPFSKKFYLANSKLDIEGEVSEDEGYEYEAPEPTEKAPTTGGDGSSDNVNVNPGTGR